VESSGGGGRRNPMIESLRRRGPLTALNRQWNKVAAADWQRRSRTAGRGDAPTIATSSVWSVYCPAAAAAAEAEAAAAAASRRCRPKVITTRHLRRNLPGARIDSVISSPGFAARRGHCFVGTNATRSGGPTTICQQAERRFTTRAFYMRRVHCCFVYDETRYGVHDTTHKNPLKGTCVRYRATVSDDDSFSRVTAALTTLDRSRCYLDAV